MYRNRGVNTSDRIRGMSESGPGEVFTVCEGGWDHVYSCIKEHVAYVGGLFWEVDLIFGLFPQGVDDFPGCGG